MAHPDAIDFGRAFQQDFYARTKGGSDREVPMFQKMMKSFTEAGHGRGCAVFSNEFHGRKSWVNFTGVGSYSRLEACCELADVMVVAYSPQTGTARLSFIQAKSERTWGSKKGIIGKRFSANMEQWDLLARRPTISGASKFTPPPDLLSSAVLPSVGSFAFFHKDGSGGYDIYYASAHVLQPGGVYTNSKQQGSLLPIARCIHNTPAHGAEAHSLLGAAEFGTSLASLQIGTPIDLYAGTSGERMLAQFAAIQIGEAVARLGNSATSSQRELAREFMSAFDINLEQIRREVKFSGAATKAIVLLRGNPAHTE